MSSCVLASPAAPGDGSAATCFQTGKLRRELCTTIIRAALLVVRFLMAPKSFPPIMTMQHLAAVAALLAFSPLAASASQPAPAQIPQVLVDACFFQKESPPAVAGFQTFDGQWEVADGVVSVKPAAGPKLVLQDAIISTGKVGAELFFTDRQGGNIGLLVKVSQAGVGADRWNGYEVSLYADRQVLHLARHRQNYEPIGYFPCSVPVGRWIALAVEMTETTLKVFVDGKLVHTYQDLEHPLASGQIAFRPWQREARYRNLWLEKDGKRELVPLAPPAESAQQVCRDWFPYTQAAAQVTLALEPPSAPGRLPSQRIDFTAGHGEAGIQYLGPGAGGLPLRGGRVCRGYLWATSRSGDSEVWVGLHDASGSVLAESRLSVPSGSIEPLPFSLEPQTSSSSGRFVVKRKSPGSISLFRVYAESDDWAWPDDLQRQSLPPMALVTRYPLSAPNAVGLDLWMSQPRAPGCSIRIVDPAGPGLPSRTIFEDPEGCIYDLNISDDAQTLFFSYRRKDEPHWHLWRIATDGTGLRQLTDGPFYDVSACPMPNGEVVFVSTRRFGHTVCQPGPASNLYSMAADGSHIRCVSMNTLSDFSPQMLPDGRVLFTRWEYIDRDLTYRQSLWTQYPDGTAYQLYFGNTVRDVGTFWQARPLPNRNDRVVATFAPHHGFPHGAIGLIDRSAGPEEPKGKGFRYITTGFETIADNRQEWAYRDPFPLSDRSFLCSCGDAELERYRIYLLSAEGRKRLLYEDPVHSCYFPLPLTPKSAPASIPPRADALPVAPSSTQDNPTGTVMLADVYRGLEPAIARGQVKSIRVMEQVRKTEDLRVRAFDQSPLMSYGTYYAKRDWGTVPVEQDGSAHFRVPALREIYFQVLDDQGRELQRMTSALQLMPGERLSCLGCHEPRQTSPRSASGLPIAAHRPPRNLTPPSWGRDGILDFPGLVQPVLDKYCVECHGGADPGGGYDLSGDKTRYFSMSYDNLLGRSRSYRQHNMDTGEMLPEEAAKGKPLVHFFWLLRTPTAVNQPLTTGTLASRLPDYFEQAHVGRPVPLEDKQRIYAWIDANVPYYGTYADNRPDAPGWRDLCCDAATGQPSAWYAKDYLGVYDRRCAECHGKLDTTIDWEGRFAWINFTRPVLSPALTAHLPKELGGRWISTTPDRHTLLFSGTDDPDYRTMLEAIGVGKRLSEETPRADMPGFVSRPEP